MTSDYFDEGDLCPRCEKSSVVWLPANKWSKGMSELKCQKCYYNATDVEKGEYDEDE